MWFFLGQSLSVATDPTTLFLAFIAYIFSANRGWLAKGFCWVSCVVLGGVFTWWILKKIGGDTEPGELLFILGIVGYTQALVFVGIIGLIFRKIFGPKTKKEVRNELTEEYLEAPENKDAQICFQKYPDGIARCTLTRGHGGPHIAEIGLGKLSKEVVQWDN